MKKNLILESPRCFAIETTEIPTSGHFPPQEKHKGVVMLADFGTKHVGLVNQVGNYRSKSFTCRTCSIQLQLLPHTPTKTPHSWLSEFIGTEVFNFLFLPFMYILRDGF